MNATMTEYHKPSTGETVVLADMGTISERLIETICNRNVN